jgi:3',5'-cyclic AMP phosphodiesterase CpdA
MAVLSDPHARPGKSKTTLETTWVQTEDDDPGNNPLAALAKLIDESDSLSADVLLCPGDLCDQAEWGALEYVWERLADLASRLGAEVVIATAGNHDIDSQGRHKPAWIAEGLRELDPPFPMGEAAAAANYWDERVSIVKGDAWRVVTLNSTLMRELDEAAREHDHGEISKDTLELLKSQLQGPCETVNVLMCHHHPLPSTNLNPSDRSQMDKGDQLVRLLDDLDGPWFVVHGHKHEPDLEYLGGTANAPVRLASGSVGAMLRGKYGTHVRNQFHVVEFPVDRCEEIHLMLGGYVRSWTWRGMTGWEPALEGDGLPAVAGFGHKRDGRSLAREIFSRAQQNHLSSIERPALLVQEPKLEFMLPKDLVTFADELEAHGCHVQFDRRGNVDRVVIP